MALLAPLSEARENLRLIRQTMERSTKYSTLSGWSGISVGTVALIATWLSVRILNSVHYRLIAGQSALANMTSLWCAALVFAIGFDFAWNKRRAKLVGKTLGSRLGVHIVLAALPGFIVGGVLTYFLYQHGLILCTWAVWMLCYGLAISAVGLYSVRPVSLLGASFLIAGAISIAMPVHYQALMMAVSFGGFHIVYGLLMARKYGW